MDRVREISPFLQNGYRDGWGVDASREGGHAAGAPPANAQQIGIHVHSNPNFSNMCGDNRHPRRICVLPHLISVQVVSLISSSTVMTTFPLACLS
ncbi:MAG: hypothetical protein ACFFCW_47555, partial [Candidatus Hodarchaeota archaeon]